MNREHMEIIVTSFLEITKKIRDVTITNWCKHWEMGDWTSNSCGAWIGHEVNIRWYKGNQLAG